MSSICSTVVEHSPRHPKVKGSIPATTNHAVGGGGGEVAKNVYKSGRILYKDDFIRSDGMYCQL
jgi:hypothetical protein